MSIFRDSAVDRLATPDNLEQAITIAKPRYWIILSALFTALIAALVFSVVIYVPVKAMGKGILVSDIGVLEYLVTSSYPGRIVEVNVQPGDSVKAGQIIAKLEQPEARLELENAIAEYEDAQEKYKNVLAFQTRSEQEEDWLKEKKTDVINSNIAVLEEQLDILNEQAVQQKELEAQGYIPTTQYLESRSKISALKEQIGNLNNQIKQLDVDDKTNDITNEREKMQLELDVHFAERKVEKLTLSLEKQTVIQTVNDGIVSELKANVGDLLGAGQAILSLVPKVDTNEPAHIARNLQAIIYVSPNEGKKIKPGMKVQVIPATVKREEYGAIEGVVHSVSSVASTQEGMMRVLRNQQLVSNMAEKEAPFSVTVVLDGNPNNFSGLAWTASTGPEQQITAGTLANAEITVKRTRVLGLLIPAFEKERVESQSK